MTRSPSLDGITARPNDSEAPDSVLHEMREALSSAGIDTASALYNEALECAQDGHYGQAQERLNILIGLRPSDGEARLLMAKILVAGKQWRRAMAFVDSASSCGTQVPEDLRQAIQNRLTESEQTSPEPSKKGARDSAELTRLKAEVRQLRSAHARMTSEVKGLEKSRDLWTKTTAGTALLSILLILTHWFVGDDGASEPTQIAELTEEAVTADAVDQAPAIAAPSTPEPEVLPSVANAKVEDRAMAALAEQGLLDGNNLTIEIRNHTAYLSGTVKNHNSQRQVVEALDDVPGVDETNPEKLVNLARRDGAIHVVRSGDFASTISEAYYGTSKMVDQIVAANPEMRGNPNNLSIGQRLILPPLAD